MQKWQKERNYKKIEMSENKEKCIIIIDGIETEVSKEVFDAYSKADRKERYQVECSSKYTFLSIEKMREDGTNINKYVSTIFSMPEDLVIAKEDKAESLALLGKLPEAMDRLTEKERELIQVLFYAGTSVREYARQSGVDEKAIRKRRDRILKKLLVYFEE